MKKIILFIVAVFVLAGLLNAQNPPQNLFVDETGYATWEAPVVIGSILVVDRDGSYDAYTDCWPAYQVALDANGYTYTYYEVLDLTLDGPDLATMQLHDCIIWFSGEAWGYYGNDCMTSTDEANLGVFLDGGGSLFFAGQDYLWASYPAAGTLSSGQFPYDYLGISNVSQDVWYIYTPDVGSAAGATGSIAEGISFSIEDIFTTNREGLYIDQIIFHNGLDLFNITSPAPVGVAAIQYDASTFRTIFSTMAFAAITDPAIQADLMANIVAYLSYGDAERDLLGYKIFLDDMGTVLDSVGIDVFEYQFVDLVNGQSYVAGVSAVYDEGESDPIEYEFIYIGSGTDDIVTAKTELLNNYPNPFNPVTNIAFSLGEPGHVTLEVYNIKGEKIRTLVDKVLAADNHVITWNGKDNNNKSVASGLYFYKMISEGNNGDYTSTKKMILLK